MFTPLPDTIIIGRALRHVAQTGSTNDDLKLLARGGAAEGSVLVADEQTAGRGRLGRSWLAPPGENLLCSVLLRPTWLPATQSWALTLLAAVAAAEGIAAATGIAPTLKWPNDLEVDGRKLGGILAEAEVRDAQITWAVIGLGLNLNWRPLAPPDLAARTVSLHELTNAAVDRVVVCAAVLRRLDHWYALLRLGALDALRTAWERRLTTLGQRITATTPGGTLVGSAEAVDAEGGLIVRTADGQRHTLHAGEVTVRVADR